ncbi:hypothetical protein SAMN05421820_101469 [Pedobacter steynii]|uniref:Lipoprotein n=1 Tax=Pedobacter steynii TaxID=430522 RepID=A0A1G9K5P0_9SPHI|nr:hypothetical protein [Pedobacter steynii]NQX38448.1 hypothetical protein [Pedobacter steynii]SDL44734.1 hypothetical protein SAMN05421820_101469 [Pedobacter steynii]
MKTLKLLVLILCPIFLLWSCNRFGGNTKRDFLPGSYVNSAEGEFSVAWDTLVIAPLGGQDYKILRKTAFQRKQQGRPMDRELRQQNWVAIFDEKAELLQVLKTGKLISIYPDSGMIVVGERKYRKLKL